MSRPTTAQEAGCTLFRPLVAFLPYRAEEQPLLDDTVQSVLDQRGVNLSLILCPVGEDAALPPPLSLRRETNARDIEVTAAEAGVNEALFALFSEISSTRAGHDILLVRAGVALPPDALARLQQAAYSSPRLAAVSPMSDSTRIFRLLEPGEVERAGLSYEVVARAASAAAAHRVVEYPYFAFNCAYFRRDALESVDIGRLPRFDADRRLLEMELARQFRRQGRYNVVSDDLYIRDINPATAGRSAQMEADSESQAFEIRHHPLTGLRYTVHDLLTNVSSVLDAPSRRAMNQLHVMHSWGGGLEKWVKDFCDADSERRNLVLKSIGTWGAFGQRLALFESPDSSEPIKFWELALSVHATAASHMQYKQIIEEIVSDYHIDAVLISSFIGHSLDLLRLDAPTFIVAHEFYPVCPALYLYFDGVCTGCDRERLEACARDNPHHRFFPGIPADDWLALRASFVREVVRRQIPVITPSESVGRNIRRIVPGLQAARIEVIPHGTPFRFEPLRRNPLPQNRRLRVLLPGRLSPEKGQSIFEAAFPQLIEFCELFLVGCGEGGKPYEGKRHVRVIPSYSHQELPAILEELDPDVGLLLSVCAETFSYTLSELFQLAIPPVATRIGSFEDRIDDGETGFLIEPDVDALIKRLRPLSESRSLLEPVRKNLEQMHARTSQDMLEEYHGLIPEPSVRRSELIVESSRTAPETPDSRGLYDGGTFGQILSRVHDSLLLKLDSEPARAPWIRLLLKSLFQLWFGIPLALYRGFKR